MPTPTYSSKGNCCMEPTVNFSDVPVVAGINLSLDEWALVNYSSVCRCSTCGAVLTPCGQFAVRTRYTRSKPCTTHGPMLTWTNTKATLPSTPPPRLCP